jgi:anthranilate synthase component 2
MIALIDNYDSFTYNLAQYLGELGAEVRVFRNDQISVDEVAALAPSHVVLSPGPGTPDDAGITLRLIARLAGSVPLLGVCLGHQAIGQAFGGKVLGRAGLHGKTRASAMMAAEFLGLPDEFGNPVSLAGGRARACQIASP